MYFEQAPRRKNEEAGAQEAAEEEVEAEEEAMEACLHKQQEISDS
jgi:hypothetical protein